MLIPTTLQAYAGHSRIFGDYGNPWELRFGANWFPLKNWPVKKQGAIVEDIINDPQLKNVHFDISWDEVAKYIVATTESTRNAAAIVNRHPDRFLFGTDEVVPANQDQYLRVYHQYAPFWKLLNRKRAKKCASETTSDYSMKRAAG